MMMKKKHHELLASLEVTNFILVFICWENCPFPFPLLQRIIRISLIIFIDK